MLFFCFLIKLSNQAFLALFLLSSAFTRFGLISLYVSVVFVSLSVSFVKDFCRGKPFLSCTSVGKENC